MQQTTDIRRGLDRRGLPNIYRMKILCLINSAGGGNDPTYGIETFLFRRINSAGGGNDPTYLMDGCYA